MQPFLICVVLLAVSILYFQKLSLCVTEMDSSQSTHSASADPKAVDTVHLENAGVKDEAGLDESNVRGDGIDTLVRDDADVGWNW